jgi:hypothetical protein
MFIVSEKFSKGKEFLGKLREDWRLLCEAIYILYCVQYVHTHTCLYNVHFYIKIKVESKEVDVENMSLWHNS